MLHAVLLVAALALPPGELTLADATRAQLAALLELGGHGRLPTERAAFLVVAPDGESDCVLWPRTGQFRRASFSGDLPAGTFALAHTHPADQPAPSPEDFRTAAAIGLPVLVLTPRRVAAAMPDGREEELATGWWSRDLPATAECSD